MSERPGPLAAALVLLALTAQSASGVTVSFPDFSTTTGLALNGAAAAVSTSDGTVLRLVPAAAAKSGSVFSSTTVNAADFSSFFSFRITNPGGISDGKGEQGADGFVFVVQPISSSVGVEFDIFFNGASDTSTNHLGIDLNGNVNSVAAIGVSPRWDDGNRWYAWVDYDGTTLEVRANQTGDRPVDPLLSRAVDIPTLIGQQDAFVGFTAGTGAAWAAHDIVTWTYFDHFNPGGPTTTTSTSPTTSSTSSSSSTSTTSATNTSNPSTSTTSTFPTTSTTTIPEGDPCDAMPDGPTFRSLNCRLTTLITATEAADALGDRLDNLIVPLGKAMEHVELAERLCAEGKARQPKVRLRHVARLLSQYSHRLRSRSLRRQVLEENREPFAQAADAIKVDARRLQRDLRCPDDAGIPQRRAGAAESA